MPEQQEAKKPRQAPKALRLKEVCRPGVHDRKEELWEQLDTFVLIQKRRRDAGYNLIPLNEAADYFGITVQEMTATLSSPQFTDYCMARMNQDAQIATRSVDSTAVKILKKLGDQAKTSEEMRKFLS